MAHKEGYYGAYGDKPAPGTEKFQPSGEPDNRDKRGDVEGFGVPASAPSLPVEPDAKAGPNPFEAGPAEEIRRTTNEKPQDISDPGMGVEPGV